MDDLISRQEALDAMDTWDKFGCNPDGRLARFDDNKHYVPYVRYDDMVYAIKSLPSAQPEQRWIPCSERLPEEAGTYLCTCVNAERWMVTLIKWQPRMRSWNLTGARAYWKVVAWKPLPEPYKEREQDD